MFYLYLHFVIIEKFWNYQMLEESQIRATGVHVKKEKKINLYIFAGKLSFKSTLCKINVCQVLNEA